MGYAQHIQEECEAFLKTIAPSGAMLCIAKTIAPAMVKYSPLGPIVLPLIIYLCKIIFVVCITVPVSGRSAVVRPIWFASVIR
jgi:hypothetical protein